MPKHRQRPRMNRTRLDALSLEARRLLTTLVAIVDTGVDLQSSTDAPYYDLSLAYDAYRWRPASQYGASVVQDNGHTPDGVVGHWHGSTVADEVVQGIVDAKAQPGAGGADVEVLPIRATNDTGSYDTGAIIRGIHYAVDSGAAVIDLSFKAAGDFASSGTGETLSQAIAYANSKGAVVSTSAGNDHVDVDDPSNPDSIYPLAIRLPNMLVSAAVDSGGALSSVSNWGPVRVDLGAPAVQGATSYAAGYTSGVTGVVAALTPGMSADGRIGIVKQTVTPTAESVGAWSSSGGVINPAGAVAGALRDGGSAHTLDPTSIEIAAGSAAGSGSFVGDSSFVSGGNVYQVANPIDTSGVTDPAPTSVYQTERWSSGTLVYSVPKLTPGGTYSVRLDFSENYFNAPGQRLMDVAVNGTPALTNFDIFAAAGGEYRAVSRSVTATADASGRITITIANVRGGAKVDAIRVSPATPAPGPTPVASTAVSLAGAFNAVGISSDANPSAGNIDGWGYSYSSDVLGTSVDAGGVSFNLGTTGTPNAVKAQGQTVAPASGRYSSLRLLGTGVNGTQTGTFTVHYTDGTSTRVQQTFSDWYLPTGAAHESTALTTAYRNATGSRDDVDNFSLYAYTIALDPTKTVKSVTLPTNNNIALLAASLVS